MRLKNRPADFRLSEILVEDFVQPGEWTLYRATKQGCATREVVEALAEAAGVDQERVSHAGEQGRDGITVQHLTIQGGRPVQLRQAQFSIRTVGTAARGIQSGDVPELSVEMVLRDLDSDAMRALRVNLQQVRQHGLPAYFDDPRFGCLRHGQGFIVPKLIRGDVEGALKDLVCAPSPFGPKPIEAYKADIARHWGDWKWLSRRARGRRGETLFGFLAENPRDFAGALTRGITARERTIHLFAYQSHLWNRALALRVQEVIPQEMRGWLPCDDGALPVHLDPPPGQLAELEAVPLPLPGRGESLTTEAQRLFDAVFRAEGVSASQFRELDLPGFRPKSEERPILLRPRFLRAAPAEKDDLHPRNMKMRLRFTLARGQYPALVAKRLALPRRPGGVHHRIWIAAHCQIFPDAWGHMPAFRPEASRTSKPWKKSGSGKAGSRSPWERARPAPPRDNPWPARPTPSPWKGKDET